MVYPFHFSTRYYTYHASITLLSITLHTSHRHARARRDADARSMNSMPHGSAACERRPARLPPRLRLALGALSHIYSQHTCYRPRHLCVSTCQDALAVTRAVAAGVAAAVEVPRTKGRVAGGVAGFVADTVAAVVAAGVAGLGAAAIAAGIARYAPPNGAALVAGTVT